VRFGHAIVPNAICSPSRASLVTGLYPSRHGMVDCTHSVEPYRAHFDEDLPTWSQRLAEAGYTGAYYGKWHVERTGKLEYYGFAEYEHKGDRACKAYRAGLGVGPERQLSERHPHHTLKKGGYRPTLLYGVTDEPEEASEPYYFYSRGIDFIQRQAARGVPWLCAKSAIEPHDPYVAPARCFERYDSSGLEVPASWEDDLRDKPAIQRRIRGAFDLTREQAQQAMACYYGACTFLDEQVGRIVGVLEELGQLDNTIVIYTSDHGDMLAEHGLFTKGVPAYEGVYNVPLVIAGPGGMNRGRVIGGHVSNVDLAPTLLELTGARTIEDVDGRLLGPHLRDEVADVWETPWAEGYAEFHGQRFFYTQRTVWWREWKYVFNGFDVDELYDLRTDPGERRNLAAEPEHRRVLEEMAARKWRRASALGDHNIVRSDYPMFRFAPVGPHVAAGA
jgi:arylsulfatase A-like enzyme